MTDNKRVAKNAMLLYFRMGISMLVSLYTSRIILKELGASDLGVYNVVGGVVSLFVTANVALTFATQRFITFSLGEGNKQDLNKVFTTSFFCHLAFSAIVFLLLESVGYWFVNYQLVIPNMRMEAANWVFQFSVITTFFSITQVPYTACIIAHERMNIYAYLSFLDVFFKLLIVLSLSYVKSDKLIAYGALLLFTQITSLIIYRIYCIKHFEECIIKVHKDYELYKRFITYSGWGFIGALGSALASNGGNIMLNLFFGPVVNAARSISMQINNVLGSFISNLQTAFNPRLTKLYASNLLEEMKALFYNNIKYSLMLLWLLFLPIFLELNFILKLWLVTPPNYTLIFCQILLFRLFLSCFEQPFNALNSATGKNKKYSLMSALFLNLTLPIAYIAILMFKLPYYLLLIDLFVYIAMISWKFIYLRKKMGLSFLDLLRNSLLPVAKVMLFSFIVPFFILYFYPEKWERLFCIVISSILGTLFAVWCFGFNAEIKRILISKIQNKYKK